jgi:hypothetical protein
MEQGGREGVMTLRRFAALAGSSAVVILVGWVVGIAGFGSPEAMDASASSVARKGPFLGAPRAAAPDVSAAALPIADAAIVDPSLLVPHPILAPSDPTQRLAALSMPDPVHNLADEASGSIQSVPALAAVKKAIVVPKLDKDGTFTIAQIAEIKAGMNLRPDQEQYWPQVEAVLRDLARQFVAQKAAGKKAAIGATEAQRLYWAAGPLIMSMTEDQKQEIRRIARAMGLAQIASLL